MSLLVNTTFDGRDEFAGSLSNIPQPSKEASEIVKEAESLISKNIPVGMIDVSFYNGSDNGLMELMKERDILFKLSVYGGWNTASNSLGFAMGQGMMMPYISEEDKNDLLMTRYLDEWAYEANIRQELGQYIANKVQETGDSDYLKNNLQTVEAEGSRLLKEFSKKNLYSYPNKKNVRMELPWVRTFENKVIIE